MQFFKEIFGEIAGKPGFLPRIAQAQDKTKIFRRGNTSPETAIPLVRKNCRQTGN